MDKQGGGSSSTSGTDRPAVLGMRDGRMLKQGTRTGGYMRGLMWTHMVMLGSIQYPVLAALARDNDDGLWNRINYMPVNPPLRPLRKSP